MRSIRTILVATLACLAAAVRVAGEDPSTIELRSTVLVGLEEGLTLADIAELRGSHAQDLGPTPIELNALSADAAGWRRIDAQALRSMLEGTEASWGLLELRGGPCYVRSVAMASDGEGAGGSDERVDRPATPGTVRDLAERWIAQRFKAPLHDLEVRWTSATDGLLDHATAGLTPYFDDAGLSDRMRLEIVMYDEQASAVVRGRAEASVRIRRNVAVLARDVRKRQILNASDVRLEQRWLDAGSDPADADAVIGREAAANLKSGAVVKASDVHASVAIERGERVQVRVITPTVTVMMLARARADGRPGEIIEFEKIAPTRADRVRFQARVEGPGAAVMVSGGTRQ
ncbi:hypothetical protein AY599_16320 [Leptolyngbya valderiana BDU 20041]|nr:hypothetical protein AY599_16320 [Leptolyngbya valderiana BDU 20041]